MQPRNQTAGTSQKNLCCCAKPSDRAVGQWLTPLSGSKYFGNEERFEPANWKRFCPCIMTGIMMQRSSDILTVWENPLSRERHCHVGRSDLQILRFPLKKQHIRQGRIIPSSSWKNKKSLQARMKKPMTRPERMMVVTFEQLGQTYVSRMKVVVLRTFLKQNAERGGYLTDGCEKSDMFMKMLVHGWTDLWAEESPCYRYPASNRWQSLHHVLSSTYTLHAYGYMGHFDSLAATFGRQWLERIITGRNGLSCKNTVCPFL